MTELFKRTYIQKQKPMKTKTQLRNRDNWELFEIEGLGKIPTKRFRTCPICHEHEEVDSLSKLKEEG